jgi:inorganic pyrophosphatase
MDVKYHGSYGKDDFRVELTKSGKQMSFINDINLDMVDRELNMIVEIPKNTSYKLEISKDLENNPIVHDMKGSSLRFTNNPYPFNYGAFPQTWENPDKKDPLVGFFGDNDPLDVCEIGTKIHNPGDIIRVTILGVYAMIDAGECDWKVVVIDSSDHELEKYLNTDYLMRTKHDEISYFLKYYKTKDGHEPNILAFNGQMLNSFTAMTIVKNANQEYLKKPQK